jgi:CRP/FNR family transcriptional regulator, cyclic AMP receptor protein
VESLFDALSDAERREVVQRSRRRAFKGGEVVFHDGEPGDTLHIIESGLVAVRGATPLGDVTTFAVLAAGETFGEVALVLDERERSATVVAITSTRTLALHRRDFDDLRAAVPALGRALDVALALTVRRLSARLLEAHFVAADKRVARRLVELASIVGEVADGTVIPFTQDDLAGLAGASRPTVNKILQELRGCGAIDLGRGRVVVSDAATLLRRAR